MSEEELHKPRLVEVCRYTLSPATLSNADIPVFKEQRFGLTIDNGDNPPLQITALHTGQSSREIVAWLEKGKHYSLIFDAFDAQKPTYDLAQFSDSIPVEIPEILLQEKVPVAPAATTEATEKPFPRLYIWLIMLGIVALLAFLTWRLTAEMRKTNRESQS